LRQSGLVRILSIATTPLDPTAIGRAFVFEFIEELNKGVVRGPTQDDHEARAERTILKPRVR